MSCGYDLCASVTFSLIIYTFRIIRNLGSIHINVKVIDGRRARCPFNLGTKRLWNVSSSNPIEIRIQITTLGIAMITFSQCEEGWRAYEDRCYYFSTSTKSWDDARTDCVGRGSHLMSILDIPERVSFWVGTEIFWIGLNDIAAEGVWEWTDGSTFLPFLAYVVGGEQGRWNDDVCTSRRKYICKRPNRRFNWPINI
uniref:C-type lectin domain-containing protein n=1 Tax=Oncorhynchus kisutch TaxID=8019 RepID=A0A8C7I417_ONCKI